MKKSRPNQGFFLVIAGNIGVGKTTLTGLINEKIGWQPYYEAEEENPYLSDFYNDMGMWGFHSQIFFLSKRFRAHLQIESLTVPVIQDRSIYEDAEVFVESLHTRGILPDQDYATYRELYQSMLAVIRPPDLILYLRASPWTLLSRIRKRWREVERDMDKEYLFQLNLAYEKWIREWGEKCPVEIVETDGRDFVEDPEWADQIIARVKSRFDAGRQV